MNEAAGGYPEVMPYLSQQETNHSAMGDDQMAPDRQLTKELLDAIPELIYGFPPGGGEPVEGDKAVLGSLVEIVEAQPIDLPEVELAEPPVHDWFTRHDPSSCDAALQIRAPHMVKRDPGQFRPARKHLAPATGRQRGIGMAAVAAGFRPFRGAVSEQPDLSG